MMDLRYHLASLMSVFLALAVGIVVGVSLGSSERQAATIQSLQRDVAAIRAEDSRLKELNAELRRLLATREDIAEELLPLAIRGRLTGNRIAFTRIGGGAFRIGVMNASGGGEKLLTNSWQDEGPSWAPNGQFVMFHRTSQGSGTAALMSVHIDGGQPRRMPTPVGGSDPSWSPLNN